MDLHLLHNHLNNLLFLHTMNIDLHNGLRIENWGMADDLHRELYLYWHLHSLLYWHYIFDIDHFFNESIDVDLHGLLLDACDCLLDYDLLNLGIFFNSCLNFNHFSTSIFYISFSTLKT